MACAASGAVRVLGGRELVERVVGVRGLPSERVGTGGICLRRRRRSL